MSDSSLSDPAAPDDSVLELELRKIVQHIYETGNLEQLTIKRVRAAAESNLELEDGFFKQPSWKDRSKTIIEAEAKSASHEKSNPPTPARPKSGATKRSSPDSPTSSKRRRISQDGARTKKSKEQVDSEDEVSDIDAAPPEKIVKSETGKPVASDESKASEGTRQNAKAKRAKDEESDAVADVVKPELSKSELSELVDEAPKPKKRKGKSDPQKAKSSEEKGKRGRKKKERPLTEANPDAEEVKRLQGWLIKCGIRKMWARELKPYDTPKAKIKHLKEMLADAGMAGRYSIEKASQIREARELQADLAAVQEGAKLWGKSDEEKEEEVKPKRRLARGLEGLDFGDSDSD